MYKGIVSDVWLNTDQCGFGVQSIRVSNQCSDSHRRNTVTVVVCFIVQPVDDC